MCIECDTNKLTACLLILCMLPHRKIRFYLTYNGYIPHNVGIGSLFTKKEVFWLFTGL